MSGPGASLLNKSGPAEGNWLTITAFSETNEDWFDSILFLSAEKNWSSLSRECQMAFWDQRKLTANEIYQQVAPKGGDFSHFEHVQL